LTLKGTRVGTKSLHRFGYIVLAAAAAAAAAANKKSPEFQLRTLLLSKRDFVKEVFGCKWRTAWGDS
jgi:hypothetical protein